MANETPIVGTGQRRAVIGRRISGGASSSPIVSPALGTTSEPAKSAAISTEPVKETQPVQKDMTSTTDYSGGSPNANAEVRSDAIRDGLGGGYDRSGSLGGGGMAASQSQGSLKDEPPIEGGLLGKSMFNGPSDTHPQSLGGSPQQALGGSPQQTLGGSPQQTLGGSPQQTLGGSPQQALGGSPQQTLGGSPQQTLEGSPQQTLGGSPQQAMEGSPQQTLGESPQQAPPSQTAYQQADISASKKEQMDASGAADSPIAKTEREAEPAPSNPVTQTTKPVVVKEEVVSNPNPTIGSYMASKDSGNDDLYSLLNGIGKESNLEKRRTMKEIASGLLGGIKKKPKEV